MKVDYAVCTDQGQRYDHNEDHYALPEANATFQFAGPDIDSRGSLFIVCDGMGGGQSGEIASEMAANWVMQHYYTEPMQTSPAQHLDEAIHHVNAKIYQLSQQHSQYQGMATTLIALLLVADQYHIRGVGDSRVYRYQEEQLQQLSEDQSEVWTLYKRGFIDLEQMRHHPRKNIVEQVVGHEPELEIGLSSTDGRAKSGDIYLLCSDGLSDLVDEDEMVKVIANPTSLQQQCDELTAMANQAGGRDNITALLVRLKQESGWKERLVGKLWLG